MKTLVKPLLTLTIATMLVCCTKEESQEQEILKNSLVDNPERFGEPLELSKENVSRHVGGTYYIESYTSETPKDWNGDGVSNTDLLLEMDPCMAENTITFFTEIYGISDEGTLCENSPSIGFLYKGDLYASFDEEFKRYRIALDTQPVARVDFPFPTSFLEVEMYNDSSNGRLHTIVSKVIDYKNDDVDIIVLRQTHE